LVIPKFIAFYGLKLFIARIGSFSVVVSILS